LEHAGYRTFCLWSLFLGLQTLPLLRRQSPDQQEPKIQRHETLQLFHQLREMVNDQTALDTLFQQAMAQAEFPALPAVPAAPAPSVPDADSWFMRCYQGALGKADLVRLINSADQFACVSLGL
jgi:hypothetical protein